MNSTHLKRSPDREYPAIILDMTNFMEHLSDEYICGKGDVREDGVRTNPKIISSEPEDCPDLGEISSVSGIELEREEKVDMFNVEFVVFYHERIW